MKSAPGLFSRRILKQGVPALIVSTLSIAADPSLLAPARAAGPCDAPVVSKVACENSLPGTPSSDWEVTGSGDSSIQGFATSMSVNVGQTIGFKVKSSTANYHIDIVRFGYYQGEGARKVAANIPRTVTTLQTGGFPTNSWNATNYWVDEVFTQS